MFKKPDSGMAGWHFLWDSIFAPGAGKKFRNRSESLTIAGLNVIMSATLYQSHN